MELVLNAATPIIVNGSQGLSVGDVVALVALSVSLSAAVTLGIVGLSWAALWRRADRAAKDAKSLAEDNARYVATALSAMTAATTAVENHSTLLYLITENSTQGVFKIPAHIPDSRAITQMLEWDSKYMDKSLQEIRLITGSTKKKISAAQQLASGLGDYESLQLIEWCIEHHGNEDFAPYAKQLRMMLETEGVWHGSG